jgi:hypothetical protein
LWSAPSRSRCPERLGRQEVDPVAAAACRIAGRVRAAELSVGRRVARRWCWRRPCRGRSSRSQDQRPTGPNEVLLRLLAARRAYPVLRSAPMLGEGVDASLMPRRTFRDLLRLCVGHASAWPTMPTRAWSMPVVRPRECSPAGRSGGPARRRLATPAEFDAQPGRNTRRSHLAGLGDDGSVSQGRAPSADNPDHGSGSSTHVAVP